MAQATITNFFVNRKRPALDDLKGKNKVMVMSPDDANSGYSTLVSSESFSAPAPTRVKVEGTVVFSSDVSKELPKPKQQASIATKPRASPRPRKTAKPKDANQPDLNSFLRGTRGAKPTEEKISTSESRPSTPVIIVSESSGTQEDPHPAESILDMGSDSGKSSTESGGVSAVTDSVLGSSLSSDTLVKKELETDAVAPGSNLEDLPEVKKEMLPVEKSSNVGPSKDAATSSPRKTAVLAEKKTSAVERARRELSLGDIRSKLTRSARLAELKASLTRFEDGRAKLSQIEQTKKNLPEVSSPSKPQLTQFNSIQLEVPVSPSKSPMKSPMKSPQKCHPGSRSPAFQRYSSLVQPGTPALTLPYSYRHLAEVFRCVDTVVSLLFNRKEIITFEKLQPAVQEMSRKTFTQHHLAQMMTVFPEAFSLKQEKFHSFGSSSLHAKYRLVITPVFDSGDDNRNQSMTPSLQLERRRRFFNNLLELVKNHHEDFLKSLEPPLVIPRGSLTRWHPEFAVDQVPEVPASSLPQPPNMEKCNSAKDVLACARQLYSCNPRMEKALENVAQSRNNGGDDIQAQNVRVEVVDSPAAPCNPPSPTKSLQISAALKGIPKALLEKIRAKQAAKALEAMTRTSAQDKEACQYSRLPDLARILRNVFVTEKKGALQLETVLEKVGNSYGTAMSPKELEEHLRLLAKAVPGWIKFEHLLKTDYVRLSKNGDMNNVMKRLDDLARVKLGSKK